MKTRLWFNKWNLRPHKTASMGQMCGFGPLLHKKVEAAAIKNMTS